MAAELIPDTATLLIQDNGTPLVYKGPSIWDRRQEFMNNFWVYEIIASIMSVGMLIAIFCVLKHYNSTVVDAWNHSWAFSSLIGLLATACQISMAVPLGSGISQLKWVWYKDSQKLTDLDKFDQCSRGPMGSLLLLLSRPFKFLGAIGAILTLLTLAFHTLIQNAISTRSGILELEELYSTDSDRAARYPQGNNYNLALDYSTGDTLGDQGPVLDMVADINYGMLYAQSSFDSQQLQLSAASCSTGNCSWHYVTSLGVCSKCADVSSYINKTGDNYNLTLYDMYMPQDIGLITSVGRTLYPDNNVHQGIGPLLVHFAAMVRGTVNDEPVGVDCALYWCVVEERNVTMINYNITKEVVTSWTDISVSSQTTHMQTTDVTLTPSACFDESGNEVSNTTKCTKTVSFNAQLALQNFFVSDVVGFTGMATKNISTNGWDISSEFIQLLYTTLLTTNDIISGYSTIMENICLMMTSNIRQSKSTPQGDFPFTLGQTYIWTTLYYIRWGFLVLPTLLVVCSIAFLLVAIFKSWGIEKWKSSLLPLLFHPLGERPGVTPHKISELRAIAEAKEVRLERTHLGSKFV